MEFVNTEFESEEHFFYFYGDRVKYPVEQRHNVVVNEAKLGRLSSVLHHVRLIPQLFRAKKIIIHGLFNQDTVKTLALVPWVLKKCYWVIWGGDLYSFQKPKIGIKNRIYEKTKAFVIKRIGYLVTYIPGDAQLAREWYGAQGEYKECLMYLSNVVDSRIPESVKVDERPTTPVNILVGNSADPSNNHFEVLDRLEKFKNEEIQVFAPLSYGDQDHAKAVIEYGANLFGNKFIPITKFMHIDEYKQFLESINIAIFHHKRQQGMGNAITLLGLGKKVYLRKEISHTNFILSLGVSIKSLDELNLSPLREELVQRNIVAIRKYFNIKTLSGQLENIFR